MRKKIAGPVRVRAGQTAHLYLTLKDADKRAFCEIYSSVGKAEPSPHVPAYKLDGVTDGRPSFTSPTAMRLGPFRTQAHIKLEADLEATKFYVFEDVDTKQDKPKTRGRITRYDRSQATNPIVQAFRWICGGWRG